MKTAIFSPYLDTLGGGERYIFTFIKYLTEKKIQTVIFWPDGSILDTASARFGMNFDKTLIQFSKDDFLLAKQKGNYYQKFAKWHSFDYFLYYSDGSVPFMFAKNNLLLFQAPFTKNYDNPLLSSLKKKTIKKTICYSEFVKSVIDRTFGLNSDVLYPPVNLSDFKPLAKKKNYILSVGRFDENLNSKRQDILIDTFIKLVKNGLAGWKLILVGGLAEKSKSYNALIRQAGDYPIDFYPNVKFDKLQQLYGESKLYWQATGFGADLKQMPEKAEHFGMAVAEAMSAGCVPLCFNGGGFREIINNNTSGYLWKNQSECMTMTKKIISRPDQLNLISKAAITASRKFSQNEFFKKLEKIIS